MDKQQRFTPLPPEPANIVHEGAIFTIGEKINIKGVIFSIREIKKNGRMVLKTIRSL